MNRYFKMIISAVMLTMMLFSSAVGFAAPEDEQAQTESQTESGAESLIPTPIVAGAFEATQAPQEETAADTKQNEKRSGIMSVGGVFILFFIAIIINAAISFAVANRFYKLSKKDSHLQSEIRALRRDLDEKFSGNIKEIREQTITVSNSNSSYADELGIKSSVKRPEKKSQVSDDAIAELAKKWNIEIERDEEPKVDIKPSRSSRTGARTSGYSPKRGEAPIEEQAVVEDDGLKTAVKSRAKEIMEDIFPLNRDK